MNLDEVKRALIHQFDESFVKSTCGHDYYEGDINHMIRTFQDIVKNTGIIQTTQHIEEENNMFKTFFDDNFVLTYNYRDTMTFQELFEAFRMWYRCTYNNMPKNMPSNNELRTFMDKIVKHNRKGYVGIVNKNVVPMGY